MIRLILLSVVLVLCCLASGYVGYEFGGRRATSENMASAGFSLDAAKKLRAGKVAEATADLEVRCFACAANVLSESGWRPEAFRRVVAPSLLEYRHTYRTNQPNWSPMEQRLESLLAQKH